MELCMRKTSSKKITNNIRDSQVKQCFQEYKLQDKVDALKYYLGIKDKSFDPNSQTNYRSEKSQRKKLGVIGVKECLQPSVPSAFQVLIGELRDTVSSSYWNKEIGKTAYLVPNLPAGCDPVETTFGKATIRDEHAIDQILKPQDNIQADTEERVHALYRRSHNDYYPSEQVDRKYESPFDRFSSFGGQKKIDISGKKVANCIRWINSEPMTLVSRRLAEYYDRTEPRIGRPRNHDTSHSSTNLKFSKNADQEFVSVADTLNETYASQQECNNYCSEYAEKISKSCESWREEKNIAADLSNEKSESSRTLVPKGALKCDEKSSGDRTSVKTLLSPNIFTKMGLSHVDFFKVRDYNEIRSIFENIGIHFPGDSFDVLWKEGLTKDRTEGVCVETFRNLLPKIALKNCNNESM